MDDLTEIVCPKCGGDGREVRRLERCPGCCGTGHVLVLTITMNLPEAPHGRHND